MGRGNWLSWLQKSPWEADLCPERPRVSPELGSLFQPRKGGLLGTNNLLNPSIPQCSALRGPVGGVGGASSLPFVVLCIISQLPAPTSLILLASCACGLSLLPDSAM